MGERDQGGVEAEDPEQHVETQNQQRDAQPHPGRQQLQDKQLDRGSERHHHEYQGHLGAFVVAELTIRGYGSAGDLAQHSDPEVRLQGGDPRRLAREQHGQALFERRSEIEACGPRAPVAANHEDDLAYGRGEEDNLDPDHDQDGLGGVKQARSDQNDLG